MLQTTCIRIALQLSRVEARNSLCCDVKVEYVIHSLLFHYIVFWIALLTLRILTNSCFVQVIRCSLRFSCEIETRLTLLDFMSS